MMLRGLIVLIAANALGEALRRGFSLPISGPVLGMVVLFLLFVARGSVPAEVERTSGLLLQHLSLFFVPAGVGVVTQFGIISREWPAMVVALIASSILGLLATAAALHGLDRLLSKAPGRLFGGGGAEESPASALQEGGDA
jgi:holin-like protein